MRNSKLVILILLFNAIWIRLNGQQQSQLGNWITIYTDNLIEVQVRFIIPKTTVCEDNNYGKRIKYAYRVRGQYRSDLTYLNWKFQYLNCYNELIERIDHIELSNYQPEDISNWMNIESLEYNIEAQKLVGSPLKVNVSRIPQRSENVISQILDLDWQTIHKDNLIEVQVGFIIPDITFCESYDGDFIQYAYRIKGKYQSSISYLNWKFKYLDCDDDLIEQKTYVEIGGVRKNDITDWYILESPDFVVKAQSIEDYGTKIGVSRFPESGEKTITAISEPPKSIIGNTEASYGDIIDLKVSGGSLGKGASWIWYEGVCGGRVIGEGESIQYEVTQSMRIYVRAVGEGNTTNCVYVNVVMDNTSKPPSSITGSSKICSGEKVRLKLNGGYLATGATWVWYTGACGQNKLTTGESIEVQPDKTTRFFVRAEGNTGTSDCVDFTVEVVKRSEKPIGVAASRNTVCKGESVALTIVGGHLSPNATWHWSKSRCDGVVIGKGSTITVNPVETTRFFVKAVGGSCGNSECASVTIEIETKTYEGYNITQKRSPDYKNFKILTVQGPETDPELEWQWYKHNCNSVEIIGKGNSIRVLPGQRETYAVIGSSPCGNTSCLSTEVRSSSFDNKFFNTGSFMLLGFGFGVADYSKFSVLANVVDQNQRNFTSAIDIERLAVPVEVLFYPVFLKNLSIGTHVNFAFGTTPRIFSNGKSAINNNLNQREIYQSQRFGYGTEVALGFNGFKFMVNYQRNRFRNDYTRTVKDAGNRLIATYRHDSPEVNDNLGFGIRLGDYKQNNTNANAFIDLTYTISHLDDLPFNNVFTGYQGFSIQFWKLSGLKLQFGIKSRNFNESIFKIKQSDLLMNFSLLTNVSRFN
jgi:hypothetical protein